MQTFNYLGQVTKCPQPSPTDFSCWRFGWLSRSVALLFNGGIAVYYTATSAQSVADVAAGVGIICAIAALWWVFLWRPKLCLTNTTAQILNPFGYHEVSLRDVIFTEHSYFGLQLKTLDKSYTVWCIQKDNYSIIINKRARFDRVAEQINERAARAKPAVM
jgi:hypothetical protein